MKNKNGFTLTEVLAVIAIISVISLIAVPSVMMVTSSIKERLYNSKIDYLVSAAELYGQDNSSIYGTPNPNIPACATVNEDEACVQVKKLIEEEYAEIDIKTNTNTCTDPLGCVVNPKNNASMNEDYILIKKKNNGTIGIWMGKPVLISEEDTVIDVVCNTLLNKDGAKIGKDGTGDNDYCDCTDLTTKGDACLVVGDDPNNYVLHPNDTSSGTYWRIMGVYCLDNTCDATADETGLSVKMVTDNNILVNE